MTEFLDIVGGIFILSVGGGGTYALYRFGKSPLGQRIGSDLIVFKGICQAWSA